MAQQTLQNLARGYRKRYEEAWFLIYTVILVVSAIGLSQEITQAAEASGGLEGTLQNLLQTANLTVIDLGAFLLGVYLCLILVLFLDHKKRMQSILLGLGTTIGLLTMLTQGVFFVWFDSIKMVIMVLGFLVGLFLADFSELRRIKIGDPAAIAKGRVMTSKGQEPIEFPRAERTLYLILTALVVLALIDANLQFSSLIVQENGIPTTNFDAFENFEITGADVGTAFGLMSAILFLFALRLFIGYEADRSVVVLGPPGSGKTHLYLGLYRAATNQRMHPRGDYEISRLQDGMRRERGFVDRTREQQSLGFTYTVGTYFPKDISLRANDYPGEYFYHIADGIRYDTGALTADDYRRRILEDIQEGKAVKDNQTTNEVLGGAPVQSDGGTTVNNEEEDSWREDLAEDEKKEAEPQEAEEPSGSDQKGEPERRREIVGHEIVPDVMDADLLVFVLDMKAKRKEVEADPTDDAYADMDEAEFKQILTALNEAGKTQDVKIVATKSDYLLDSFEEQYGNLEIHNPKTYTKFRKHVNRLLAQGRGSDIKQRVREEAYPVFYETDKDGEKDEELVLNKGEPLLFGFGKVLRRFGR